VNGTATCDGAACGFSCNAGFHECAGQCASNAAPATCGASCTPCPAPPANATATCDGTACGFACNVGFARCGGGCCLAAPANVAATPGPARVDVTWDAVPGATGYHLYWSIAPGVTPANGTLVTVAAPPFQHAPLRPSTPVHYVVAAVGAGGEGLLSSEAAATPLRIYGSVAARYPANGANWNDYVKNDGATRLLASDAACDPAADTGGYSSCLHGGEMRAFTAGWPVGCTGVTAEDDAVPGGAFNWLCDSSAGFRMVSGGLKEGVFLSDLMVRNTSTGVPGWKPIILRVSESGVLVSSSHPEVWWSNPVVEVTSQSSLASPGTVYVAGTRATAQALAIAASRVALVLEPASTVLMLQASSSSFLWVEGSLGGSGHGFGPGLQWSGVDHSVIRGLGVTGCMDCPTLVFQGTRDSFVSDVTTALGWGALLDTTTTTYARLHFTGGLPYGSTDAPIVGSQVGGTNNAFTQVTASGGSWLMLGGSTSLGGHALVGFTGANSTSIAGPPSRALVLGPSNTVAHAVVTNAQFGLTVNGAGNRIVDVAACDNGVHGLEDWASGTLWEGKLILGDNGSSDCWQPGTPTGTPTCPAGPQVFTGCTLAGHFVGKVATPDAVNQSAANPTGPFFSVTDWTRFVDRFRGWGVESTDAFPAASTGGRCFLAPVSDCRMWDWSLMVGPARLMGNATGRLVNHVWYRATPPASQADCNALVRGSFFIPTGPPGVNVCQSVVLLGAIEVAGDGIGNDNGLCENGETCWMAPNLGSYQGHGALVPVRDFEPLPGFLVKLVTHEWNGYTSGATP